MIMDGSYMQSCAAMLASLGHINKALVLGHDLQHGDLIQLRSQVYGRLFLVVMYSGVHTPVEDTNFQWTASIDGN